MGVTTISEEIETEIWFVLGDILKEYGDFGDRLVDVSFWLGVVGGGFVLEGDYWE